MGCCKSSNNSLSHFNKTVPVKANPLPYTGSGAANNRGTITGAPSLY